MLKRLAIMAVIATATWQAAPSSTPQGSVLGQSGQHVPPQHQSKADAQKGASQPAPVVEIRDSSHGDQKAADSTENRRHAADKGWSLADKIALGACIFAGLQSFALILTIAIMIRNGRRQLRAYVVVERGIIANVANPLPDIPGEKLQTVARIISPLAGPHVQITIKNTGQTPAYEVVHWSRVCVQEYPLASTLPGMPQPPARFWSILGPGVEEVKTVRLPQPLSPEQIKGLHDATTAIYCHGEIRYRDIFKKRRITRYRCMYYRGGGLIGVNTDLTYCEDGNDAT